MRLRRRAADWRPRLGPLQRSVPPQLKTWLDEPGSLTARLQAQCGGGLQVALLCAQWGRPTLEESRLLRSPLGRLGWVREVTLGCGGVPWVYARTIIPRRSLRGRQRALLRLGTRPLGSVLFGPTEIRRGPLQVARLQPADRLYAAARPHCDRTAGVLWARRSILSVAERPLLVTEVFLPALLAAVGCEES